MYCLTVLESEFKVVAEPCALWNLQAEFFATSGGLLVILSFSSGVWWITPISAPSHHRPFLPARLCLCGSSPLLIRMQVTLPQRPTRLQHDFILTDYICSDPVQIGFPGGSEIKNPTAKQEMWVQPLGRPSGGEMATSVFFTMDRSLAGYGLGGHKRVGHDWAPKQQHFKISAFWETGG